MKKIIAVFILFLLFNTSFLFSQTAKNTEEITVLKKTNPKIKNETLVTSNTIITTEKMKNPNKKNEVEGNHKEAIINDQKQKNPKNK